ncbi:MAG: TetR/AcrR family transcriptional regulator [Novosphingobium sp.]
MPRATKATFAPSRAAIKAVADPICGPTPARKRTFPASSPDRDCMLRSPRHFSFVTMLAIACRCQESDSPAHFTGGVLGDRQLPASEGGMASVQGQPERRMGPVGSENWSAMLDAAEAILREEGHAALTSRSIAERISVKQRLVYYYFRTMDDLIVALFERLSIRELQRLTDAREAEYPLRAIWDICIHTTDARLISQFMALANRIQGLRQEVIKFIEESRAIQVELIRAACQRTPGAAGLAPEGLAIIASSVALSLTRERQLGTISGHAQIEAMIEKFLELTEPR